VNLIAIKSPFSSLWQSCPFGDIFQFCIHSPLKSIIFLFIVCPQLVSIALLPLLFPSAQQSYHSSLQSLPQVHCVQPLLQVCTVAVMSSYITHPSLIPVRLYFSSLPKSMDKVNIPCCQTLLAFCPYPPSVS
jgi:hypothetical protein